jgi:hypothetical protein
MHLRAERAALREDATRLIDDLGGTVHEVTTSLGCVGIRVRPSDPDDSPQPDTSTPSSEETTG